MQRTIVITCLAAATAVSVVVAQQEMPAERRAQVETELRKLTEAVTVRARGGALETRVTSGKPYTADAVTEFVQVLSDGNRIVRRTTVRLSRDSEGRTRRETLNSAGETESVAITDPVSGVSYVLDPRNKTVMKTPAMFASFGGRGGAVTAGGSGGGSVTITRTPSINAETGNPRVTFSTSGERVAVLTPSQSGDTATTFRAVEAARAERREAAKESLGEQTIEGVLATGTRTTTTIAAGAIGNELPIAIVSEQWSSPELDVLVLTKHSDPRSGETTYRLINLARAEPDRTLFQAPADYTVIEPRKAQFDWQREQQ